MCNAVSASASALLAMNHHSFPSGTELHADALQSTHSASKDFIASFVSPTGSESAQTSER
jgi:hypothetical protein